MQFFVVLLILFSVLISMAPLAHPGTIKSVDQPASSESVPASSGALGEIVHGGVSAVMEGAQISNPLTSMKETAEEAAKSLGRNLGQYIRGKYQQIKNNELLDRFDAALQQSLIGLPLTAAERQKMTRKVEEAYVHDAEKEKPELDQQNFTDLSNVIKKEYSEILLGRTLEGTIDTYDVKGRLKTRWILHNGQPDGSAVTYYPDQEIKFIDIYREGKKISRKKFDEEGKLEFEQHYDYDVSAPAPVPTASPVPETAAPKPPEKNEPAPSSQEHSLFESETKLFVTKELPSEADIEVHNRSSAPAQKPSTALPAEENRPV